MEGGRGDEEGIGELLGNRDRGSNSFESHKMGWIGR